MSEVNYKSTLFACYLGYITQALIVNLPPILFVVFQSLYGLSYTQLGSLVFVVFITQLIVDALAAKYIDLIGQRAAAMLAHILAAVGMVALAFLPRLFPSPYAGLVVSSIIYAIGGGLIEVLISPIVESLPGEAKASAMSLLHSFYSWGQVLVIVLSTLGLLLVGHNLWWVLPLAWSVLPLYNFFKFMKVPLVPPIEESQRIPLSKLLRSKIFLIALLLMVCSGASEQAMAQWVSLFAEKGLGITKALGDLFGPCIFAIMMGIVRTWYGVKGQNVDMHKALTISSVFCIASFIITAAVPIPALALAGSALCGLSVALMWPGMLSLTAAGYPTGGVAMFAILALGGDLGCSIGPQLTGVVADASSLNCGLVSAIIFPLIMLFGLAVLGKLIKKEASEK